MNLTIQPRRPPPPPPRGTALSRAVLAVLVEHRLPYQAARAWDRAASALGMKYTTIRAKGLAVAVRRLTTDEQYVRSVLEDEEYRWEGYEIGESDTVVDIGGNIGSFALLAAVDAPRGRVVTVEPVEESFRLLQRNIARNGLRNAVAVHAAVMDRPGRVKMLLHRRDTGGHSVDGNWRGEAEACAGAELAPAVTLAELFRDHAIDRCDLLKMDCEGAEFPILQGLSSEMYSRIDRIVMEYHCSSPDAVRAEAGILVDRFASEGYRIDSFVQHEGTPYGLIRCRRP